MDKIWYRNPSKSEDIGRCGGVKKSNDHAEPPKVERKKNKKLIPTQNATSTLLSTDFMLGPTHNHQTLKWLWHIS